MAASLGVVLSSSPVRSALSLILAFIASAVLWLQLSAEFLALVLIFVYVGAVMTLFLFVVMMINVDHLPPRLRVMRFVPLMAVVFLGSVFVLYHFMMGRSLGGGLMPATEYLIDYSSTAALGAVLYTDFVLPFEVASVILLVAIIAAIALVFRGRMPRARYQTISKQIEAQASRRVRLVSIDSDEVS